MQCGNRVAGFSTTRSMFQQGFNANAGGAVLRNLTEKGCLASSIGKLKTRIASLLIAHPLGFIRFHYFVLVGGLKCRFP